MEERESVFRKKSLDRVNSPEELDQYLKVTNPSLWIFFAGVIALLFGVVIWSATSKIDAYVNTGCLIKNGSYSCYIDEDNYSRLSSDNTLKINDQEYEINLNTIEHISSDEADSYLIKLGEISSDDVFEFTGNADLADGYYAGKIITEKVSPISFILD